MNNQEVKLFSANTTKRKQRVIIYFIGLIVVIILQTTHYSLYYKQPLIRSLIWSFVDWSIWFILFSLLFYLIVNNKKFNKFAEKKLPLLIGVCLLFPILHALLSKLSFLMIFESKRYFIEDIIHQLSKKWFQNIFISFGLYFLFDSLKGYFWKDEKPHKQKAFKEEQNVNNKVIVKDGKSKYQLFPAEINFIESAKNYIIITTKSNEQIVVRKSITAIYDTMQEFGFIRISRSLIVNKKFVHAIKKRTRYSYSITTKSNTTYPIGRTYLKDVISFFE